MVNFPGVGGGDSRAGPHFQQSPPRTSQIWSPDSRGYPGPTAGTGICSRGTKDPKSTIVTFSGDGREGGHEL